MTDISFFTPDNDDERPLPGQSFFQEVASEIELDAARATPQGYRSAAERALAGMTVMTQLMRMAREGDEETVALLREKEIDMLDLATMGLWLSGKILAYTRVAAAFPSHR